MAAVAAADKRAERAALGEVADIIATAVRRFDAGEKDDHGLFGRIVEAWSTEEQSARLRGIALDIALIHIASMSNLAAALGWALVDLLEHPSHLERICLGDKDFAQRCALESTRLAQRSIMTRAVLSPLHFDTGEVAYQVPPGWTIATLLPLLNTSAAPGLDEWNPERWNRHRLIEHQGLPSPLLVTAFGHGRHSCPAQPFSLAAMTATTTRLLRTFQMAPLWTSHPQPVPAQIGGVARADGPCPVDYASSY
jgi:cytochrome P450